MSSLMSNGLDSIVTNANVWDGTYVNLTLEQYLRVNNQLITT